MDYLMFAAGFVAGFITGIGATIFYMKRKMKSQMGEIEQHLDAMDDMMEANQSLMSDHTPMESESNKD